MKSLTRSFFVLSVLFFSFFPHSVFADSTNAPKNLTVRQTDYDTVLINWDAADNDPTYGQPTGYTISINPSAIVTNQTSSSASIKNLVIGTKYSVSVMAIFGSTNGGTISKNFSITNIVDKDVPNGGNPINAQILGSINGQKMHGGYQNNTNTCANCHSTHTATGSDLLSSSSVYKSCISCHDGSMGFYNVFESDISNDNGAGTFGGTYNGNMSVHLSTGVLNVTSAQGSEVIKDTNGDITSNFVKGKWDSKFTCTSCHSPHGSSNDRLLDADPNGYSRMPRQPVNGVYYGGLITEQIPVLGPDLNNTGVFDGVLNAETALNAIAVTDDLPINNYKAVRIKLTNVDITTEGSPYKNAFSKVGDYVIGIYKYDKYLGRWTQEHFKQISPTSGDGIDLLDGAGTSIDWKAPLDPDNPYDGEKVAEGYVSAGWFGFVKVPNGPVDNPDSFAESIQYVKNIATMFNFSFSDKTKTHSTVNGYPVYKIDIDTMIDDQTNSDISVANQTKSTLNQLNEWCATCHVGFNISSKQKNDLGQSSFTHHSSSEDNTDAQYPNLDPCVTCHYSHGTDATWMKGADGMDYKQLFDVVESLTNIGDTFETADHVIFTKKEDKVAEKADILAYLTDTNPSSSLKRYANTTSCFKCHGTNNPAQ